MSVIKIISLQIFVKGARETAIVCRTGDRDGMSSSLGQLVGTIAFFFRTQRLSIYRISDKRSDTNPPATYINI